MQSPLPIFTPPINPSPNPVTFFAETDFRGQRQRFGIKQSDRRAHCYIVGQTGTGKTTLLQTMIQSDLAAGHGLAVFDPHGDMVERIVTNLPPHRQGDLLYLDAPNPALTMGFNPFHGVLPAKRSLAASGMLEVFKKLWNDSWGPRLEHLLRNGLLTLLEVPGATLADLVRLLEEPAYRRAVVPHLSNPQVRRFWVQEYEAYPARFRVEVVAPLHNKIGAFLADPILLRILTRQKDCLNLRRVIDSGKILVVNLAKGRIGEDSAALLGALLVSQLGLAGLSRADTPELHRRDFYVYLDEFQLFTTMSLASMLSELRKYRVNLVLAHQYLAQLDERMQAAILGNVGTTIVFRVGLPDAEILHKAFWPEVTMEDLINLPNYACYVRLMIDGVVSRPFSARTLEL